ncbi:hypothetical protein SDC9_71126 [bioreactor metagenome]|uniref:Uncharacterized protein n=1 Tax=bioreactor metagenome TaxID=1076179 RepID=A0A644YDP6_9ZZZZ
MVVASDDHEHGQHQTDDEPEGQQERGAQELVAEPTEASVEDQARGEVGQDAHTRVHPVRFAGRCQRGFGIARSVASGTHVVDLLVRQRVSDTISCHVAASLPARTRALGVTEVINGDTHPCESDHFGRCPQQHGRHDPQRSGSAVEQRQPGRLVEGDDAGQAGHPDAVRDQGRHQQHRAIPLGVAEHDGLADAEEQDRDHGTDGRRGARHSPADDPQGERGADQSEVAAEQAGHQEAADQDRGGAADGPFDDGFTRQRSLAPRLLIHRHDRTHPAVLPTPSEARRGAVRRPLVKRNTRWRLPLVMCRTQGRAASRPAPRVLAEESWPGAQGDPRHRRRGAHPGHHHPGAAGQADRHHPERQQRGPQIHHGDRPAVRVATPQQLVVQVALVGHEPPVALVRPADPGEHQVEQRQPEDRDRQDEREVGRQQIAAARLQFRRVELAGQAHRGGGQQEPEEHRPGVAHEHLRRVDVVRQEPQADPDDRHRDHAGGRGPDEVLLDGEDVGVGEEGRRPDADHAGRQTVQAVDEVHRVGADHHEEDGQHDGTGGVQRDDPVGQRDPQQPDAGLHHDPRGQHLPGELGDRTDVQQIVEHPDGAQHGHGDQDPGGVVADDLVAAEERQVHRQQEGDGDTDQHRHSPEVRRRHDVDVPGPDLGHGPEPDRRPPGPSAELVGDRGGHQQDEDVFAHR